MPDMLKIGRCSAVHQSLMAIGKPAKLSTGHGATLHGGVSLRVGEDGNPVVAGDAEHSMLYMCMGVVPGHGISRYMARGRLELHRNVGISE